MLGSTDGYCVARRLWRWRRGRWRYAADRRWRWKNTYAQADGYCNCDSHRYCYRDFYRDRYVESDGSSYVDAYVYIVADFNAHVDGFTDVNANVDCLANEPSNIDADKPPDVHTDVHSYDESNAKCVPNLNSKPGAFGKSSRHCFLIRAGACGLRYIAQCRDIPRLRLRRWRGSLVSSFCASVPAFDCLRHDLC